MVALSLLLLALSAGTYLLIKVTREYLSNLFKFLAWLIIVISLLSIAFVVGRGVWHLRHMRHHMEQMDGRCSREEHIVIKEMGTGHCEMDNAEGMSCCKMQGDSVMMDRGTCEKMMGKEACDKMCHERGKCIMSKDECTKMCNGKSSCCGADEHEGNVKECCKKKM